VTALLVTFSGCDRELAASLSVATFRGNGDGPGHTAFIGGVVRGRANNDGTACFWLGSSTVRLALVWPPGSGAERHPLRVVDRFGNTVVTVGEKYSLGGGSMPGVVLGCTGINERLTR
jgi:hypothetical protein